MYQNIGGGRVYVHARLLCACVCKMYVQSLCVRVCFVYARVCVCMRVRSSVADFNSSHKA